MILRALLHFPRSLYRRFVDSGADLIPQKGVNLCAFMGRWYEQARFENDFEYGLDRVFSDYTPAGKGAFYVCNNGMDEQGRQQQARGMAHCEDLSLPGQLRVSFVPPYGWFSSPLTILYADSAYQEALLAGSGGHYLWLLTREARPSVESIENLLREARKRGFDTTRLRHTRQDV